MKGDAIEGLLQKAENSLNAAEYLNQGGFFDFAASRAYYTMFYAAGAMLLRLDMKFSTHSAVIAVFGRVFAKSGEIDPKYHQ